MLKGIFVISMIVLTAVVFGSLGVKEFNRPAVEEAKADQLQSWAAVEQVELFTAAMTASVSELTDLARDQLASLDKAVSALAGIPKIMAAGFLVMVLGFVYLSRQQAQMQQRILDIVQSLLTPPPTVRRLPNGTVKVEAGSKAEERLIALGYLLVDDTTDIEGEYIER